MTIMNLIEDAFSKKDFEEVIELCDEIPKNRNAMAYKASSLRLMDRPQEALDVLDMADYPNNPDYHYIRAEALMDMEQYESAIESFERIFELEVSDETSLTFMKMNYNACLALRCDELIEMEKYVDAWKVNLKSQSPYSIEGFTRYVRQYSLPNGITDPTIDAALLYTSSKDGLSSGSGKANSQNLLYNAHFSYKGRYNVGFSLRADGNSKFGPKQKWGYFPGVSLRYNVSDEPFFKPLKSVASMLGLRASWGIVGKAPDSDYLFYNTYSTGSSPYGSTASMDGLRLDDLRWEKTQSINLGFNVGFLNDKIEVDFDYYHKKTDDLLQKTVTIPSTTGYSSIKYSNVGTMTNDGWEMNINAKNVIKAGKFSFSAGFNIAQNYNEIKEMDKRVLDAYNSDWVATSRGSFQNRVQVGNPLGSIYGFRYKGVYKYSFDYLQNYNRQMETSGKWKSGDGQYENWINELLKDNTAPVVRDVNGKVIMNSDNTPRRMVYNYVDGTSGSTYEFQGGDAIYEDINHDGQINALDIVYLGNSQPKMNGGFNLTFSYGPWQLKARFNYRWGNKIINAARRDLESMSSAYNQASSVNWRWRKDGDETMMPRAIYVYDSNSAYNYQGSDRYVEDGSFLRLNNLQISYAFPKKTIKKWGLSELKLFGSLDNVFCWTKYSGIDPEINPGGWGLAVDNANTPRPKQFTATISMGF